MAGVQIGTAEYAQKMGEFLQSAKDKTAYYQGTEEDHNKLAADMENRLKANNEIMNALKREDSIANGNTEEKAESDESSIENEPLSPVMQKYEATIENIISQSKQLKEQAEQLKVQGKFQEAFEFESQANKKSYEIFNGGGETYNESFIENAHKSQKAGESYSEFQEKRHAPVKEYRQALYDSPKLLLKIASEAGRLEWQKVSGRLLRDKEFIEAVSKTEAVKNDPYFQRAMKDDLFETYARTSDGREW